MTIVESVGRSPEDIARENERTANNAAMLKKILERLRKSQEASSMLDETTKQELAETVRLVEKILPRTITTLVELTSMLRCSERIEKAIELGKEIDSNDILILTITARGIVNTQRINEASRSDYSHIM